MFRPLLTILRGSVLAQIIGIAALPLLTRNFTPEAFGAFQIFQIILSFLLIIVSFRYEIAVLKANDGDDLNSTIALCLILTMFSTLIVTIALIVIEYMDINIGGFRVNFPWWLLTISMFVGGCGQLFGYVAARSHSHSLLSNSKIVQSTLNAGSSSILAVFYPISSGLIVGDFVGRAANLIWLVIGSIGQLRVLSSVSLVALKASATKYRNFAFLSMPSTLIGVAGAAVTPLLIYNRFDAHASGQFGLVERSAGLPVGLIVLAISQVHMSYLSSDLRFNGSEARRHFLRIAFFIVAIGAPIVILCVLFAIPLFRVVFGSGWEQAARFSQLMAPAYFLALISGGLGMTLVVVGYVKTQLFWDTSRFVIMMMLWFLPWSSGWPVEKMVFAHSAVLSCFSALMLFLSYRALPRGDASLEVAST